MGLLEFLELFGLTYERFSKEKSRLISKWKEWESSFQIIGTGKESRVFASSFDVFFFQKHAREVWKINLHIDYKLLYQIYNIVLDYEGEFLPPYATLGSVFGVHQNTIAKYVTLLDTIGIIKKQTVFQSANRKRIKVLPMFHETFKVSLLRESKEQEIDWHNHVF